MERKFAPVKGYEALPTKHVVEGYSVSKPHDIYVFVVNVSAERLNHVFYLLSRQIHGNAYFVLEVEQIDTSPPARDVYFWKGIGQSEFWGIYGEYSDTLIQSAGIRFGYASHSCEDEVYVGPYKTLRVFTQQPEKYTDTLAALGISRVEEHLTTVADVVGSDAILQEQYRTRETDAAEIQRMIHTMERGNLRLGKRFFLTPVR